LLVIRCRIAAIAVLSLASGRLSMPASRAEIARELPANLSQFVRKVRPEASEERRLPQICTDYPAIEAG